MAVRNDNVSGIDFVYGDNLVSTDVNDTFDAFYDIVKVANWE